VSNKNNPTSAAISTAINIVCSITKTPSGFYSS
jgi:hypothetical protein